MKKTVCAMLCAAIVCGLCGSIAFQAKAAGEVYVTHNFPSSIKLGDSLSDLPDTKIYYHNVPYTWIAPWYGIKMDGPKGVGGGSSGGPIAEKVDSNGNTSTKLFVYSECTPGTPGTWVCTPGFQGLREPYPGEEEGGFDGVFKLVGPVQTLEKSKFKVTIEEPIITTNAPSSVKIGSTIQLTTALTNHHIKNKKVADYAEALAHDQDPNFHIPDDDWTNKDKYFAYQPSVTVIEGKDLVRQSNQDYSNTLSTSETLTFTGAGTVKLKVVYHQINTDGNLVLKGNIYYYNQPEKNIYEDHRYHPEKIITINVTDPNAKPSSPSGGGTTVPGKDSASPSGGSTQPGAAEGMTQTPDIPKVDDQPVIVVSEETGIRVGAQQGVLPDGTELSASPVTQGEMFDRVGSLMTEIADRFSVFDLALESGGVRVQPNGKVTVSIPIPEGYERGRLAIYYIDENGVKTELPCAVDGDTITFETDHFSTYVVAEKSTEIITSEQKQSESSDAEDQPAEGSAPSALWITLDILGAVLVVGSVITAVLIRRRRVQK